MRWGLPLEIPRRTLQELPAIARTAEEGGYTDGWPGEVQGADAFRSARSPPPVARRDACPGWVRPTKFRSKGGEEMAVTKIIELVGSSPDGSDAAVEAALREAQTSLRNIKAVDVVSTGLRGDDLSEWRALVRVSFLVERVGE
jgi:hypothetical protein